MADAESKGGNSPLTTDKGTTTIDDGVVEKIAGIAAREVPGVYDLGSGAQRAIGAVSQRMGVTDERTSTQGVAVEVGERQAAADIVIVVEYGESIPDVSSRVRENVSERIQGMTGLEVTEVNLTVSDLHFPGDDDNTDDSRVQ